MQLSGYHMGNVIGQGGMATVYHAEHILLKQERALKVMSPELTNQPGFSDSFICEGQFIAALQHPNIVSIYDISEQGGMYFMVMEYLHGGSLEDRLPLPLADSIKILQQIGSALHYAHQQQLIHRDIKPANILFNSKGDAILTDFGISKLQDTDSPLTLIGCGVVGTPRYMSPEQRGGEALDKRSDIYSLALVFYEMLSGEKAIKEKITASIVPDLPPEFGFLQNTLNKGLAKTADKRYPDVLSFVQDVINEKKRYNRQLIEKEHQRKMRRQLFAFLLILVVIVGSIAVNIDWKANSNQSAINSLPPITDLSVNTEAEKEQIIPAKKVAIDPSKTIASKKDIQIPLIEEQQISVLLEQDKIPSQSTPLQKEDPITTPLEAAKRPKMEKVAKGLPTVKVVSTESLIPTPLSKAKINSIPPVYKTVRVSPYILLYEQPNNQRIGQINKGVRVKVTATTKTEDGKSWSKIIVNGKPAYVKTSQIK